MTRQTLRCLGFKHSSSACEISQHFLNPEALLIPGDCLLSVVAGGTQLPNTLPEATDDDVNSGRSLVAVLDSGEEDGGAFNGVRLS